MRLHHLTMEAFGPFPETAGVDFDELHEAGLFLLAGPTGAGKTSILDAVCFALYGSVPGARGVKVLKSQHADPQRAPEVVLDFTVRGRRFRIRRSPEWSRPKRRGTGTTVEKARATLVETTSGEDQLWSSRAQEIGHLVQDLVGMSAGQFQQVAMLPQGEFQTFLRASSQERHTVLQQLFHTDRFARIEEWVHEHSRGLKDRAESGRREVQRILDTVADRSGVPLPEELAADDLARAAEADRVLPWVGAICESAAAEERETRAVRHTAEQAATGAAAALETARRRVALVQRRDRARADLASLAAEQEAADEASARIAADDRAARCRSVIGLLDDTTATEQHTHQRWEVARQDLEGYLGRPVAADDLADLEQETRDRLGRLDRLLPRLSAWTEAARAVEELTEQATALDERAGVLDARVEALPAEIQDVAERLSPLGEAPQLRETARRDHEQAEERLAAAREAADLAEGVTRLEDEVRGARDAAADARQHALDLTARRLAGVAAELAGRLVPGEPCAVCGGLDHPAPAEADEGAVSAEAQEEADAAYDRFAGVVTATQARAQGAQARLAALHERAGGHDLDQASTEADRCRRALEAADEAMVRHTDLSRQHARGQEELAELREERHSVTARTAQVRSSLDGHARTVEEIGREVEGETGGGRDPGVLPTLRTEAAALLELVAATRRTQADHAAAREQHAGVSRRTGEALAEHGFAGVDEVRAATLAEDVQTRLRALLDRRADLAARAQAVLDDPELAALEEEPPVGGTDPGDTGPGDTSPGADPGGTGADPVEALRAAADEAAGEASAAARTHALADERSSALTGQLERLTGALDDWAPAREEHVRAESMSRLVRGTGGDNQLQMRLSAYVLATRLDQVVDAANERLSDLRDQRYVLQRTGRAARRGSQAGLGLEVLDQWTGDVRDPSTLSGGETFVVSLALALGLADVVTHEAGGTEIETLFVDEGFGLLDQDTLDDVMDRLDELRAGGRSVGVVSHVTELLNRIPTQLHVHKGRSGSHVEVRTLVG